MQKHIKSILFHKISKYAIIGGISTLIHMGVAAGYLYYIQDAVFAANISGFMVAYVFSYLMQSRFVFKHTINLVKAFKYFIVQFGSLLSSIALTEFLSHYNSYIKTVIIIICMPMITYIIHKVWTFNEERT